MSPLRAYRCPMGHELEVVESMDGPVQTRCPEPGGPGGTESCGLPLESIIQSTGRPIVKSGKGG